MSNWKSKRNASRDFGSRVSKIEQLEPKNLLAADVYISEFLASNDGIVLDEDGTDSDWIEVFNAGPDDVNLDGWHLTDDIETPAKWDFPNQILPAGNSLLVFASDKDRAVAGSELHANFKLSSGGEYLALTRDAANDSVEIVSAFAPGYPQQTTDVSYGVTQEVSITDIVSADADAKVLIPTGQVASSWNTLNFNDSNWQDATAAIGYQSSVPGFTVQDAKSNGTVQNLTEATAVLNGTNQASETIEITPVVNFVDTNGSGNYQNDLRFPNETGGDDNDFAIRATGTIIIPSTGTWTFGTNSDDGVRVRIDGRNVINDDTLHAPLDKFGSVELDAGPHDVELIFFERGGGAEVEFFAASGRRTSFSATAFDLVGDVANGGLAVVTAASGGSTGFAGLVTTDVSEMQGQASSAYLRVPFSVDDVSQFDSLTLGINYDDGFVAYLNGEEIARRNAPTNVTFDSTATVDRPQRNATVPEFVSVTDHLSLLRNGDNVLAIQGLNQSKDAEEFVLVAELSEIATSRGENVFFRDPTPGLFNPSEGAQDFLLNDVALSQTHGFYEDAFQLTIDSKTEGTTIRYTLDGSTPTETNGVVYSGPIAVDSTSTVRARSFKDGSEPSRTETATYVFIDDVLTQSSNGAAPENWPTSRNINGQVLDYGMDPAIVESAAWRSQMTEALTQVPSMSLVMDVDDFVGSQGIYTNAGSHGKAWERPASLELINPDGEEGFQVEAGVRVRGGFSRSDNNPKHSFRLFFRDEYGDSKLEYPLFGDEGVDEFDKFDLRTTQNYSWSFQGSSQNAFVRDVFSRDVQGMMGQPYTRSRYYHLYINGQYWGLFQTQERAEANYAESYFGGDKDDYDVVKSAGSSGGYQNEATDGNLEAYERLSEYFYQGDGLSDVNMDDYWKAQGMNPDGSRNEEFERLLDVENLIDYMLLTYYTSDADGPGSKFTRPRVNNYYGIYNRESPDGFKFFEHDSEHSLDTGNAAGANYNMVTPLTTGGAEFRYFNPHWMHEQLARTNEVYREQFADRAYEQFYNDGLLAPDNAKALIDARAAEFDMAIIAESARWGDSKRATPYTKTNWEAAVNNVKGFFDGRADVVIGQFRGQGWFPDAFPPQFAVNQNQQHGGEVAATDLISFESSSTLNYDTILRRGSSWNYLDDGSNQGTAWQEPNFDDSDWESGRSQLGYGDGDERTVLGFGPNSGDKFRTSYFRTDFDVDNPAEYAGGRIHLQRDDGAIVYLNGEEIIRSNMPSGAVDYRTFASGVVGGGDESTFFEFDFPIGMLQAGENTIAVEVHQVNASSSDQSFDLELELGKLDLGSESNIYYTLDGSDPKDNATGGVSENAIRFDGTPVSLSSSRQISVRLREASGTWSVMNAAAFTVSGDRLNGDVDLDGDIDVDDIDRLAEAIRESESDSVFDLDGSGTVETLDLDFLVQEILKTQHGDTNLDGKVNFTDFLALSLNFGSSDAGWAEGSFDSNSEVSFSDFLALSTNFGFERPVGEPPIANDAPQGEPSLASSGAVAEAAADDADNEETGNDASILAYLDSQLDDDEE